jgi:hypothetical protein
MALAVLMHTAFDAVIVWGAVAASVVVYLPIAVVWLMRRAR